MPSKPSPIDAWLAKLSGPRRAALVRLRKTIRAIVPDAEECISYGMPAFRLRGKVIAGFIARADGCSYLPFSGSTLGTLAKELEGWTRTKSSLHFGPDRPLPVTLVRRLLRTRIAELPAAPVPRSRSGRPGRSAPRRAASSKGRRAFRA